LGSPAGLLPESHAAQQQQQQQMLLVWLVPVQQKLKRKLQGRTGQWSMLHCMQTTGLIS
jgi:hypothetical protein